MKQYLVVVFMIVVVSLFFTYCSKKSDEELIEGSISDFANAVNTKDLGKFEELISEESQFYITGPKTIEDFLDYFQSLKITPVVYSNLSINRDGDEATVNADASYDGAGVNVLFVMKKHDGVWKVKEYWDNISGGDLKFIWQKLKNSLRLLD